MRTKTMYILIGVAALSMMGVCLWRAKRGGAWDPGWGEGPLKTSERAYHMNQINAVTNTWRDIARRAKRDEQGRINDPVFTCLVVDTGARRVWIESDGRILPECEVELPPQMEWRLQHATPSGTKDLAFLSRFRIPGIYTRGLRQEQVFLAGTRDGQEYLVFSFSPSGTFGTSYGSGDWNVQIQWDSPKPPEEEMYDSVVVNDEAYEQAKAQFGESGAVASEPDVLAPAKAAWKRAEKSLYQEIERQVVMQGLSLRTLELTCGPDYTAASASLHASRSGLLSAFRGGPPSAHVYLQIDSLGNDVWYARSAPHPLRPMPQRMLLDMEFLTSAAGAIPNRSRKNLLADGRRTQQEAQPQTPSKWRVNLPNGVTVEFIGLCENPSGGRQWWGPDGSPLGFAPYINYESYGLQREDRTTYEIAWRIHTPKQARSSMRSSFEGAVGSYGREIRDRYGNRIVGGFQDTGWAFDKSRETTTLKVGVSIDDGPFAWATLKDISLVRGKDQGFEISQGETTE